MATIDPRDVARALRGGPATLDALHARLGAPEREALGWAVDDAVARGWVHSSAGRGLRARRGLLHVRPARLRAHPGRPGGGAASIRVTDSAASNVMQTAEPTHQLQIASSRATST